MFVFVVVNGVSESKSYPPCGVRVATANTLEELTQEAEHFLVVVLGRPDADDVKLAIMSRNYDLVEELLNTALGWKAWSIYNDNDGYFVSS